MDIEKFKTSGKQFSSMEIVEAYESIRGRLINGWSNSLSKDSDGREQIYSQLKGLDAILLELITDWK